MTQYVLSFKPTSLGTHDYSACLFADGHLLAMVEEERLCRVKHAPNTFPKSSIAFCLDKAGIELGDLAAIGIPYDPHLYVKALHEEVFRIIGGSDFIHKYYRFGGLMSNLAYARGGSRQLWKALDSDQKIQNRVPIHYISHHLSHAASAYYSSGFGDALVLTIDGAGEYDCTVIWRASEGKLERIKTFVRPNSIGHFYTLFTRFLGFQALDGEGKVMALAAYGSHQPILERFFERYVRQGKGTYDVSLLLRNFSSPEDLAKAIGFPLRRANEEVTRDHANIAWYVQKYTENILTNLVQEYCRLTGLRNVCLAGGVALNCMANKKIAELKLVDNLFVQPAANDAGLSLGCAQVVSHILGFDVQSELRHVYWGPEYSSEEIESTVKTSRLDYKITDNPSVVAARELVDGKIVGWFQDRMEFGPRALGNRSILASPSSTVIRDRLNRDVKQRELWRPFAPSILENQAEEWFSKCFDSPFMIKSFDAIPRQQEFIPGVIHSVDKTARVHTVRREVNRRFYQLIEEFYRLTGVPMVLNTSFNIAGEPIVCTPRQAIADFFSSGLDVLVLGNFILEKQGIPINR